MSAKAYTASLSKSQGRSGFSVIFRHPVRTDDATGKPGVRVRQGLGTRDESEARRLLADLNELLAESTYHNAAARAEAERRFDKRVVEIFFYKLIPEETDFRLIREKIIRLPDAEHDGYIRALLLGTTGAGKTTLARQLIGTDPEAERFPSTSTAKTTVHDTEIIVADGPYRAAVTFVSAEETREYLTECASAAALAAYGKAPDAEVLRRMLNHVNQRYRFGYVLGNGPSSTKSDFDGMEDDDEELELTAEQAFEAVDLHETNEILASSVSRLRQIAQRHGDALRQELGATTEADERVVDELFEEVFDKAARDDEQFHEVVDDLFDEIEKRFDLLDRNLVNRTKQGWPLSWSWETNDRAAFIRAVTRFSSNYAKYFGQLLTPLVNGVRVAGPFMPSWRERGPRPKVALLDGEGLGHTPKTTGSVSTAVSRRIEEVDAVLVVDNAMQPMQAATVAAMRELVSSGNASKQILIFTHFDEVKGDNLPSPSAKVQHVMASAENVLSAIGEDLGPLAERALRKRIDAARVFLESIDKPLSKTTKAGTRTINQLEKLFELLAEVTKSIPRGPAVPRYDRMNLVLAVKSAAESFHAAWFARLGLEFKPGVGKEHWTRVKALSRRLATGMADHYDSLQPVADLRKELQDRMYVFLQSPHEWGGDEPDDDQKQVIVDALADNIARRVLALANRRVWKNKVEEWQAAYNKHGKGSTFERAEIIGTEIFDPAAPIPDLTPSLERNQFLRDVADIVQAAADECGAKLT
ncbi:MAG: hypothetical protein KF889_12890 [Alphaproteobacteria bacterium]|nr:hypothetical protein [Alphaproteobacteria bacterium]MCW5739109.1 hypothetical protein [Alphaproteobacteria bacterium]